MALVRVHFHVAVTDPDKVHAFGSTRPWIVAEVQEGFLQGALGQFVVFVHGGAKDHSWPHFPARWSSASIEPRWQTWFASTWRSRTRTLDFPRRCSVGSGQHLVRALNNAHYYTQAPKLSSVFTCIDASAIFIEARQRPLLSGTDLVQFVQLLSNGDVPFDRNAQARTVSGRMAHERPGWALKIFSTFIATNEIKSINTRETTDGDPNSGTPVDGLRGTGESPQCRELIHRLLRKGRLVNREGIYKAFPGDAVGQGEVKTR